MADEKKGHILVNNETISAMADRLVEHQLSQLKTAVNEYPLDQYLWNLF